MAGRIRSQLKPKVEKVCPCGVKFTTSHPRKIFCSRNCLNERNSNSPVWNSYQRNVKYKINYGITLEDYNELFNEQEGRCQICKRHQSEMKTALHVDHDHETGKVRGLLCSKCNLALGMLGDSSNILKSALEYLEW